MSQQDSAPQFQPVPKGSSMDTNPPVTKNHNPKPAPLLTCDTSIPLLQLPPILIPPKQSSDRVLDIPVKAVDGKLPTWPPSKPNQPCKTGITDNDPIALQNKKLLNTEEAKELAWKCFNWRSPWVGPDGKWKYALKHIKDGDVRWEDLVAEHYGVANNLPDWMKYKTSRFAPKPYVEHELRFLIELSDDEDEEDGGAKDDEKRDNDKNSNDKKGNDKNGNDKKGNDKKGNERKGNERKGDERKDGERKDGEEEHIEDDDEEEGHFQRLLPPEYKDIDPMKLSQWMRRWFYGNFKTTKGPSGETAYYTTQNLKRKRGPDQEAKGPAKRTWTAVNN